MKSYFRTQVRLPPASLNTIENLTLRNLDFLVRYAQSVSNWWHFRVNGTNPMAEERATAAPVNGVYDGAVQIRPPLRILVQALLPEGTIPTLPPEVLRNIENMATTDFDVDWTVSASEVRSTLYRLTIPRGNLTDEDDVLVSQKAKVAHDYLFPEFPSALAWSMKARYTAHTSTRLIKRLPEELYNILNSPTSNGYGTSTDLMQIRNRFLVSVIMSRPSLRIVAAA